MPFLLHHSSQLRAFGEVRAVENHHVGSFLIRAIRRNKSEPCGRGGADTSRGSRRATCSSRSWSRLTGRCSLPSSSARAQLGHMTIPPRCLPPRDRSNTSTPSCVFLSAFPDLAKIARAFSKRRPLHGDLLFRTAPASPAASYVHCFSNAILKCIQRLQVRSADRFQSSADPIADFTSAAVNALMSRWTTSRIAGAAEPPAALLRPASAMRASREPAAVEIETISQLFRERK